MTEDEYIFVASDEACPTCAALDGMPVTPGFKAHVNCMCQTIPQDREPQCRWSFQWSADDVMATVISMFERVSRLWSFVRMEPSRSFH